MTATTALRISPYIAFEASGSDISNPNPERESGYSKLLAHELDRVGTRGGTIHIDAEALLDLAEWLDAIQIGNSDSGNTSGARSCERLAAKARALAKELV